MQNKYSYIPVVIFFLLASFLTVRPVVAAETAVIKISSVPVATPAATTVAYFMPYPGLLPDHQLYFLKAFRDRTLAFLISDPIKKAEFDLLQADKRIEASYLLAKERKIDLAQETFSKGENYFDESLSQFRILKQEGKATQDFLHKLVLANQKHREILRMIEGKLSQNQRQAFVRDDKRLQEFEKTVKTLNN